MWHLVLFKVLNKSSKSFSEAENYGSLGNHNFFYLRRLTWPVLISVFIHLAIAFIPINEQKKKSMGDRNTRPLDVLLTKTTIQSRKSDNGTMPSLPKSNEERDNKKLEVPEIKGVVIGKPTGFGMQSPVNYKGFGRSKRYLKSNAKNRATVSQRAQVSRQTSPPMEAVWAILQKAQTFFPGGENLTCQGGVTFVCSPRNDQVTRFFESQWAIMHMNFPNLPSLELKREAGFWRLQKLLDSSNR